MADPTTKQKALLHYHAARSELPLLQGDPRLNTWYQAACNGMLTRQGIESTIRDLMALPTHNRTVRLVDFYQAEDEPKTQGVEPTMLEKILKMYVMAMGLDIRSPLPHLVGPAGCGKSTAAEQAAEILGVNLHTLNVSRISPLELEGAQMPNHDNTALTQLTATWWTRLKDGDIVLLDEFLRGFEEVYNGLLDILTARKVGDFTMPKVFIIAASNSVTTYDQALEDRLLHLPVADPRTNKAEKARLEDELIKHIGLNPAVAGSLEMSELLDAEVLPMYALLDQFTGRGRQVGNRQVKGSSVRKLIGQARLREVQAPTLASLIRFNNNISATAGKHQYVVLVDHREVPNGYVKAATQLNGSPALTPLQAANLHLNTQLIQMGAAKAESDQDEDNDKEMMDELFN